ncbi:MAG TPA: DNA gyrase subunit A [Anaerolineales bacterium]|nr:DNA gyrase subunit A [Anaerolineales bacterium]
MEIGIVHKVNIDDEMQQAYLDYAMSVIVARALPDARDGLKPVHRRILYAMHDMGIRAETAYKKSARIVGEVLGKYHPHGDMAVYDAMARMAQDFSLRYLLVDGQGNFGSVDGDPPAAMRYTEARMAPLASHMLSDIAKNTVDFSENFDNTISEPTVLPSALPNLLVNGATGIAVGMATSIPPHNLGEVIDALQFILKNWGKLEDISIEDLMKFIQGPDFPTGGVILHESAGDGLVSAYSTGRGRVSVQAKAHLEEMDRGRSRIIVTELPYMTNKSSLIERIAELARDEKIEGIVDLRDESDRQGMRIVIELSKNANPESVLQNLYKHTPMQNTFSIIMLALVDGEPRMLSLKQALRVYIEHRHEIVRRRSEYDLEKARQRAHILEGLRIALNNLDEVINLIRRAPDAETARDRLIKRFKLSQIQAQAILDMQLRRLAALERKKIDLEYKEVMATIKELEGLLRSPQKMRQVISEELANIKTQFGDRRRTYILELKEGEKRTSLRSSSDLVEDKEIWVSVNEDGLISRSLSDKQPRLSGRDAPVFIASANSRDTLYLVTETGETVALPVHALQETDSPSEGTPISKVSVLRPDQNLVALFSLPNLNRADIADRYQDWFIVTFTQQGMIKKSSIQDLPGVSAGSFTLAKVNEDDRLGWVKFSDGNSDILLQTAMGMAIRFSENEVRPMGLVAAGVMGMKLQAADKIVGSEIIPDKGEVFLVAQNGFAKRIKLDQFPKQGRYGLGVQSWKIGQNEKIIGMTIGKGTDRAVLFQKRLAPKSIRLDAAPLQTRSARGKSIQEIKTGDEVIGLTIPWQAPKPVAAKKTAEPSRRTRTTKATTGTKTSKTTKTSAAKRTSSGAKPTTATTTKKTTKVSRSTRTKSSQD